MYSKFHHWALSGEGKIGSGKNTKYIFFSYWAWGHVLSLKPIWQLKQEAVIYNNLNFCPLCFKGWSWQCTAVATKRICWNKFFYIIRKRGIQQLRGPNITQFWPPTHLGWTIVVYIISMLSHSQMEHYFFSYLLTWEVDLIEILEIMAQMWQYVIFLSLQPTKVTSDYILNYLRFFLKTNFKTMMSSISIRPQGSQGCLKERHHSLNKLMEVLTVFRCFLNFGSILAQELNKFICKKIIAIFSHPWD